MLRLRYTHGALYSLVVRLRPDIELTLLRPVAEWSAWPLFADCDAHFNTDLFAIMTRAAADVYVSHRCSLTQGPLP